jgi:hypothetical protein
MPDKRKSRTSTRTVIEPHNGDKSYARRNQEGAFKKRASIGRALAADKKRMAETKVPKGQDEEQGQAFGDS